MVDSLRTLSGPEWWSRSWKRQEHRYLPALAPGMVGAAHRGSKGKATEWRCRGVQCPQALCRWRKPPYGYHCQMKGMALDQSIAEGGVRENQCLARKSRSFRSEGHFGR